MAAAGDDLEAELLKKAFQAVDAKGTGQFSREDLAKVFRQLGDWSQEDLDELFDGVDPKKGGLISYAELIEYIMDEDGDEPAEDDDEEEDHDDGHKVQQYASLGKHSLDLNMYLTRDEFEEVLRLLDVDAAECGSMFDDVANEAAEAGFSTQAGIKIKWFLDDLDIDRRDKEALADLEQAINDVRAGKKAAQGWGDYSERIALARLATLTEKLGRPPEQAWDVMQEHHVLSTAGQESIVAQFQGDRAALAAKIKEYMVSPPTLPASAGQTANREACKAKVDRLVKECRSAGTKFVDPEFDVVQHTAECLYVDKTAPGYDCTVAVPAGFKRLTELCKSPVLFKGGTSPGDIKQGQIGTCFLLGALGAIAANKKDAIRRAFLNFDIELGIYGVRFCVDGEWEHVVVDDVVPVDKYNRILYAKSADPDEVWCSILEKAYCKLHTCYEMCDGGRPNQAIYSICGGGSGKFLITDDHKKDPKSYFALLRTARDRGWLLTTTFIVNAVAKAGAGKCGEAVLPTGLVGGHVYSVLRLVSVGDMQLVCCRNPWGTGEWKGRFSDANRENEWTPELVKKTGWTEVNDGTFWMCIEDFVANSGGVEYARTFNPQWKKVTQKSKFALGSLEAKSLWAFSAREKNELSFPKGATLEVSDIAPGWWHGCVAGEPDTKGFFPANYVKLTDRPVARFDMVGKPWKGQEGEQLDVVVLLSQPNSKMQRRFYKRNDNGLNYKDISYPNIQLVIVGEDGKVALKRAGKKRCISGEMTLEGGRTWRVYALSLDGKGQDFSLRLYVRGGTATLTQIEGSTMQDVTKAIAG